MTAWLLLIILFVLWETDCRRWREKAERPFGAPPLALHLDDWASHGIDRGLVLNLLQLSHSADDVVFAYKLCLFFKTH